MRLRRLYRRTKTRAGFTLAEMGIVMGAMGLILGGLWASGSLTRGSQQNNDGYNQLQTVLQNTYTLYQGRNFSSLCVAKTDVTSAMITAGVIPSWAVSSGGTLAWQPWSAAAGSFKFWGCSNGTTTVFRLSFYNVPASGCIPLIMQATSCLGGQSGCPVQITTGGTVLPSVNAGPGLGASWGMTPSLAASAALCGANVANSMTQNSVEFDYSL
jgi:hypothetical protein